MGARCTAAGNGCDGRWGIHRCVLVGFARVFSSSKVKKQTGRTRASKTQEKKRRLISLVRCDDLAHPVPSPHYRDAIGRIQWHFPCISNATAFAKAKEKLGEPNRARFYHKPREIKTYYWTRSDGGRCHLILRESSDGLLNVFTREADTEEINMIGGAM